MAPRTGERPTIKGGHGMVNGNDIKEWMRNPKGAGDGQREKDEKRKTK